MCVLIRKIVRCGVCKLDIDRSLSGRKVRRRLIHTSLEETSKTANTLAAKTASILAIAKSDRGPMEVHYISILTPLSLKMSVTRGWGGRGRALLLGVWCTR